MKRRLLNFLTALSLLLCAAVVALWVRSYWAADCLALWNAHRELSAESRVGYVTVKTSNISGDPPGACLLVSPVGPLALERRRMNALFPRTFLGFAHKADTRPGANVGLVPELTRRGVRTPPGQLWSRFWRVPLWAVALAAAALPASSARRRYRTRSRRRSGRCPACGYDLTGNVSGACPECGTAARPAEGSS